MDIKELRKRAWIPQTKLTAIRKNSVEIFVGKPADRQECVKRMVTLFELAAELAPKKYLYWKHIEKIAKVSQVQQADCMNTVKAKIIFRRKKTLSNIPRVGYCIALDEQRAIYESAKSTIRSVAHGESCETVMIDCDYDFENPDLSKEVREAAQGLKMQAVVHRSQRTMYRDLMQVCQPLREISNLVRNQTKKPRFDYLYDYEEGDNV